MWGCMYNGALRYVAFATADDGTCIIPRVHGFSGLELPRDIKGDGLISVGDLLCSSVNLASVAPSDFSGLGGD